MPMPLLTHGQLVADADLPVSARWGVGAAIADAFGTCTARTSRAGPTSCS